MMVLVRPILVDPLIYLVQYNEANFLSPVMLENMSYTTNSDDGLLLDVLPPFFEEMTFDCEGPQYHFEFPSPATPEGDLDTDLGTKHVASYSFDDIPPSPTYWLYIGSPPLSPRSFVTFDEEKMLCRLEPNITL